jgi:hypothetical protein
LLIHFPTGFFEPSSTNSIFKIFVCLPCKALLVVPMHFVRTIIDRNDYRILRSLHFKTKVINPCKQEIYRNQILSGWFYLHLRMKKSLWLLCGDSNCCKPTSSHRKIRTSIKLLLTYATQSFKEFYEMLSLPNDAHFPQDIEKNVLWCEQAFAKRGFTTQRLNTPTVPLLSS